jgi:tRNA(Ile)-lysidine synthase
LKPLYPVIEQVLQAHPLSGSKFIVAYSGGKDSTALLHSLLDLKNEARPEIEIIAAYYWHPWRPLQEDLQHIMNTCKALNVKLVMLTPDLTLPKTEAAAREDRYAQLAALGTNLKADAVLTAHHQDDQVETILFRVFRGTGIEGLTGIPESRLLAANLLLIRPMLSILSRDIQAYLTERQLQYTEDPTNADTRFRRNFIRHEILPRLETVFPQLKETLPTMGHLIHGEIDIINSKMRDLWNTVFDASENALDELSFIQLKKPFQRRILRQYLELNQIEAGLARVDELIHFITGDNRALNHPSQCSIDKTKVLHLYRHRIRLIEPQPFKKDTMALAVPCYQSHCGLKASIKISELSYEERMKPIDYTNLSPFEAYVDLSKLDTTAWVLRSRHDGDRMMPLGMKNPIKLKRLFMGRHISRFQRDDIPLIADGSEVLWAVGVELSEKIKVRQHPTHYITYQPA